jgi:hypothetical protein
VDVPLPWERLLWRARPALLARLMGARAASVRYLLTDFRLVCLTRTAVDEIALQDIGEVHTRESRIDRWIGTSTIDVHARHMRRPPLVLHSVRRGAPLAALLELLAGDPQARVDADAVAAAIAWEPQRPVSTVRDGLSALAVIAVAVIAVAIGLHGKTAGVTYSPGDAIYPNGQKKDREAIVHFMKEDVLPWARHALGPIVGGADRVRCETCHGREAPAREWRMPGVAALPQPDVRERGWERYSGGMDAQMRNAIYGYLAESDKQRKAAYMREIVMPGMARLLHRAPYDFTRPYDYNRQRAAFGCYHCHKVQ